MKLGLRTAEDMERTLPKIVLKVLFFRLHVANILASFASRTLPPLPLLCTNFACRYFGYFVDTYFKVVDREIFLKAPRRYQMMLFRIVDNQVT